MLDKKNLHVSKNLKDKSNNAFRNLKTTEDKSRKDLKEKLSWLVSRKNREFKEKCSGVKDKKNCSGSSNRNKKLDKLLPRVLLECNKRHYLEWSMRDKNK